MSSVCSLCPLCAVCSSYYSYYSYVGGVRRRYLESPERQTIGGCLFFLPIIYIQEHNIFRMIGYIQYVKYKSTACRILLKQRYPCESDPPPPPPEVDHPSIFNFYFPFFAKCSFCFLDRDQDNYNYKFSNNSLTFKEGENVRSVWCLKKNQNAPRPSEHPPVRGGKMSKRLGGVL